MTTGKRALIVDDSRSARVILSRMLEQHGMTVDTAESAEQALEYLQRNRPDVIFMDHLMPGMDGFQAVQAIKADPLTATIPLMMYTSQEGELYVSQARALGAVGVLPKTVRPVDVSRILYQLHLLPDRRTQRTALFPGRPRPRRPPPKARPTRRRWRPHWPRRGSTRRSTGRQPGGAESGGSRRTAGSVAGCPDAAVGHGPLGDRGFRIAGRIASIDAATRSRTSWRSNAASCWQRSRRLPAHDEFRDSVAKAAPPLARPLTPVAPRPGGHAVTALLSLRFRPAACVLGYFVWQGPRQSVAAS